MRGAVAAHLHTMEHTISGILLSEVETEQVSWLWSGWLALGKLSVMDGDPGLGKSATVLDVAARVSTGRDFPDGTSNDAGPGGVVVLSAEDGLSDTIKPRLEAAGADLERIASLAMLPDGSDHERLLSIPEDLAHLEAEICRMEAKLVVVDPLVAFLSKRVDSHKDQDIRRALAPLAAMADRTGAAVQLVRHLSKGEGKNPVYRGGGSIGIIGAARMGSLVAKDPKDEERRVLAPTKNNLAVHPKSLLYTLEEAANIRFHDLRHTCATLLLSRGHHPKLVQELLGHASVALTLDRYSHVLPGMGDQTAAAMEAALS